MLPIFMLILPILPILGVFWPFEGNPKPIFFTSYGGFHNQADGRLLGDFRDHSWHKTIFFRLNIAPTCLEQLMRC
jgi:hypothetical protein